MCVQTSCDLLQTFQYSLRCGQTAATQRNDKLERLLCEMVSLDKKKAQGKKEGERIKELNVISYKLPNTVCECGQIAATQRDENLE